MDIVLKNSGFVNKCTISQIRLFIDRLWVFNATFNVLGFIVLTRFNDGGSLKTHREPPTFGSNTGNLRQLKFETNAPGIASVLAG